MTEKSPRHILVVDDERLIRWAMVETLTDAGYEVSEAGNAKDTLTRLSGPPAPEVVLLDYRLPDSNDLKLLEAIRRTVPSSPVIMLTAYGSSEVVSRALHLGAYRVLGKPVELGELVSLVEQAYISRAH